jgi:translation initiation factor 1
VARARLVYSTEHRDRCPRCGHPLKACACSKKEPKKPAGDGVVRLQRETKGRKGKGVTRITGLPLADGELRALAKELKQRCGSGGTVRDGAIEIQGEHRDALLPLLEGKGYVVKKAGG